MMSSDIEIILFEINGSVMSTVDPIKFNYVFWITKFNLERW